MKNMNMLGTNIKISKQIHPAWKAINRKSMKGMKNIIGKYQYIFSSKKGEISLISLPNYFDNISYWEIYSTEGDLFEDIERFQKDSDVIPEEVRRRIFELLEPGFFDCLKDNVKNAINKILGGNK